MSNVRRFLITLAGAIALGCGGLIALAGVTAAPASAAPSCSEPPSIECTFSYTGGIQSFRSPQGSPWSKSPPQALRAGGGVLGVPGGMGAELKGYFGVTPGATVNVVVGGEGTSLNGTGGGGGASFVYTGSGASAHLMMAAAGGGGSAGDSPGSGGSATPTADDGQPVSEVPGGPGGTDGNGGSICCQVFGEPGPGGGGGGLLTNGQDYANSMGMSGGGGKALVDGAGGGAGLPGYGNGGLGGAAVRATTLAPVAVATTAAAQEGLSQEGSWVPAVVAAAGPKQRERAVQRRRCPARRWRGSHLLRIYCGASSGRLSTRGPGRRRVLLHCALLWLDGWPSSQPNPWSGWPLIT